MEQSPSWEANRSSASLEIPRILWNPRGRPNMYYIIIYFTFILTYTKSWLPPINKIIDFSGNERLGQSMLKDINLKRIEKSIHIS